MKVRSSGHTVTALLVLLVGFLLLASTTGFLATESIWQWIPLLFVGLGVWAIVTSRGRNLVGPVMVIAIAGAYQLRALGIITDEHIGTWWPLFVVLFGVLLLFGRHRKGSGVSQTGDELQAIAIFGGSTQRVGSADFQGGEAVSIFGGTEIDLREAEIEHPPAVIETVTIFGGPEIRVPEDWNVKLEILTLFGSAEDSRASNPISPKPDLVVTGVTLFGGVEILS